MTDEPRTDEDRFPTFVSADDMHLHASRADTLEYLTVRCGLNLGPVVDNPDDPRRDHAALMLDLASRLVFLHGKIADVTQAGVMDLAELNKYARERQSTLSPGPDSSGMGGHPYIALPGLLARVQELEYLLNLHAKGFSAAWPGFRPLHLGGPGMNGTNTATGTTGSC